MDVLTSAADAILKENLDSVVILTPRKERARTVLADVTNNHAVHFSSSTSFSPSLNSLFSEKITCNSLSVPKLNVKTPRKRRKNSTKFGDENQAPSPKTPKNEKQQFDFSESPVTPLSNLKMLTRIASMEEHIPSKKDLFQSQKKQLQGPKVGLRRCVSESIKHAGSVEKKTKTKLKKYTTISDLEEQSTSSQKLGKAPNLGVVLETSRREKSLGLLCERFLDHFPIEVSCLETPRRLVIDDVAAMLGTERRRVYDIVNILECLNMASRVQKNMYQWMGKQHLETTLSKLKGLAEDWGLNAHLPLQAEQSLRDVKSGKTPTISPVSIVEKSEARKEKSIGILCQKFLMLFLISQRPHIIQLETANQLLLGQEGDDLEKLRKRGRRIYDIANVLVALSLIKKIPQCKSYMYIGPMVDSIKRGEVESQNQIRLRHSLLPPPMTDFVLQKTMPHLNDDSAVTPSDASADSSLLRKGKPRILATEFVHSKAKRNCMVNPAKSDETPIRVFAIQDSLKGSRPGVQIDEREKTKAVLLTPTEIRRPNAFIPLHLESPRTVAMKPFRFTHFGSPRMALTFDNPAMKSPPLLTSRPPTAGINVSPVVVRPPFILQKVSLPLAAQNENLNKKQLYIIRTSGASPVKTSNSSIISERSNGCFKVYSRNSRTLSLPSLSVPGSTPNTSPVVPLTPTPTESKTFFPKSFSQTVLPNVSLNTLSRNHYKTVFSSSSQLSSRTLSTPSQGLYHFVINPKETKSPLPQNDSGKDTKQPKFVKMIQSSPDNSSTDSELESIFGDSFKFTRPKNLVNKM